MGLFGSKCFQINNEENPTDYNSNIRLSNSNSNNNNNIPSSTSSSRLVDCNGCKLEIDWTMSVFMIIRS